MAPYWVLFGIWALGAIQFGRARAFVYGRVLYMAATAFTALMIGLRFEVGGDWGSYIGIYQDIFFQSLGPALRYTDPGYALLNWIAARSDWGIWFVNLGCAILFTTGLARLASRQPNPWLAVLIAVPYLIIVVAMGYTRQAAAIGIICWAIADSSERHLVRLIVLIGVAALFHKTAVLILPIALVPILRRNILSGGLGILLFVGLFVLVLRDNSDRLLTNYVQGNYDSQGATIRVMMNVVAAALFLALRRRFMLPPFQNSYWTTCAVIALLSVPALVLASASSGVDRMSLYLIPLQIVTYARLPYVLGSSKRALPSVLIGVIGYCFLVQFVWLNYADNALYWVPYHFFL